MLILKQTYIDVFIKTNASKNVMADENNNHFVLLGCFQFFNCKGKRFKNKFENIKLFGNLEMLEELLSRVSANKKVKIEICNCELFLKPVRNVAQAYLSCKEWNFDKNKFNVCKTLANEPRPVIVKNATVEIEQHGAKQSKTEQVEKIEVKLLGDGIDLP